MGAYTLPRHVFNLLEGMFGERPKAGEFAKAIESTIETIQERAEKEIVEKKELLKLEIKDELRNELVTRGIFEERFKSIEERFKSLEKAMDERFKGVDERFKGVDERFNSLHFKMNIFIAIALIALTFANPTFIKLIERLF